MLRFFARVPVPALLGVPLLVYVLVIFPPRPSAGNGRSGSLARARLDDGLHDHRRRSWPRSSPSSPFIGYVYGKLSLLLSAFMAGLFLGAWPRSARGGPGSSRPLGAPGGLPVDRRRVPDIVGDPGPGGPVLRPAPALGALGGRLFVVSARSVPPGPGRTGWIYGADLLGSFLGALSTAAVLIPLAGILPLFDALFLMNVSCLLFHRSSRAARRPKAQARRLPATGGRLLQLCRGGSISI